MRKRFLMLNRAIHKSVNEAASPLEKWEQTLVLMSTLALAAVSLARLSQARYRREKSAPLTVPSVARAPSGSSLFEQRQQSMVHQGNFWEAARALARQGFESALGPQFQAERQMPEAAASLLPLDAQRSWWRNWRLRRRVNRLWRLAYGAEPLRISSRRLRRLGPEIEWLKALAGSRSPHGSALRKQNPGIRSTTIREMPSGDGR